MGNDFEEKRKDFQDILIELSSSEVKEENEIFRKFENLYGRSDINKHWRHFYSDIFSILTRIRNKNQSAIAQLSDNIRYIKDNYKSSSKDKDVYECIVKLYDHINLDISRFEYIDRKFNEANEGNFKIEKIENKIKELDENIKENELKLSNTQREYVAILGIFASIVIAFNMGSVYTTSIFQNIANAGIYRIFGASIIIGMVLVNILYWLFYYIADLVNMENGKERSCKPLLYSNITFCILLGAMFCFWFFKEKKHEISVEQTKIESAKPLGKKPIEFPKPKAK